MPYKSHIAYGFHVNCYHSYRGDTNDTQGFGSDIRIIRKIIRTLDSLNAEWFPVKGNVVNLRDRRNSAQKGRNKLV